MYYTLKVMIQEFLLWEMVLVTTFLEAEIDSDPYSIYKCTLSQEKHRSISEKMVTLQHGLQVQELFMFTVYGL